MKQCFAAAVPTARLCGDGSRDYGLRRRHERGRRHFRYGAARRGCAGRRDVPPPPRSARRRRRRGGRPDVRRSRPGPRAERDARARRSAANGRRAADGRAAARAGSLAASGRLSALRATIAAEDERSALEEGDVEAKLSGWRCGTSRNRARMSRRLASRTFGEENASAARNPKPAPRAVRAGRATGENERAVPRKVAKVAFRAFR